MPSCFPMVHSAGTRRLLQMAAPPTITENGALFLAQQQMRKRAERPASKLLQILRAVRTTPKALLRLMGRRRKKNRSLS
jgi:hypothetical protein